MSPSKLFLLFLTFVASVGALSSPHAPGIHHRALAGRIAVPESLDVPPAPLRKRQNSKRCKPRPSAALVDNTKETTSTKEVATTKEAATTKETTSTKEAATTKESPTTKETATTKETQAHTTHQEPPPPPATHKPPPPTTHETTHKASPTPKPAPPPTKEQPPAPATTKKPAPPPASGLPSYLTGTNSGEATFYSTGLGACGIVNHDSDFIAAASKELFDGFLGFNGGDPNKNPICNRKVSATYKGNTVDVIITDRCVGCDMFDLDFSPVAFDKLASESLGRLSGLTWHFV